MLVRSAQTYELHERTDIKQSKSRRLWVEAVEGGLLDRMEVLIQT